jgi:hypothetical protein
MSDEASQSEPDPPSDAKLERERLNSELTALQMILTDINDRLQNNSKLVFLLRMRDIYVLEVLLIFNSCWAAYVLLSRPHLFFNNVGTFAIASLLLHNEWDWAKLALCAAALKAIGVAWALAVNKVNLFGIMIRLAGLCLSGVFWCTMGISSMVGNPDSIFSFGGVVMGIFAWWSVIRLVK